MNPVRSHTVNIITGSNRMLYIKKSLFIKINYGLKSPFRTFQFPTG